MSAALTVGSRAPATRRTVTRAVRAEWLKLRTLPSNLVTVTAATAVIAGLAAALLATRAGEGSVPPTTDLVGGVAWAQAVLAVLAVVTVCSEWVSGTSQVTFLAVPTRWPVLAGKVVVIGGVALVAGSTGAGAALALGAAWGIDVGSDPALVVRLVAGAGLYLGAVAVLALGIGTMVRDLVGSVLTVLGFLWGTQLVATVVPVPEVQEVSRYLPTSAGALLVGPDDPAAGLTPWGGYAVLLAWTAAALVGAAVTLRTRDV